MAYQQALPQVAGLEGLAQTLGVIPAYYARECTSITMKEKVMSLTGNDYSIKTMQGTPLFTVHGQTMSMSHRTEVADAQGQPLFTVRKELLSLLSKYYAEDPNGNQFLSVDGEFSFGRKKANISFMNAADGKHINLKLKGDWLDMTTDITTADTGIVVARIDRQINSGWDILGRGSYFLTIAPNVDIALMVAICICVDERRQEEH